MKIISILIKGIVSPKDIMERMDARESLPASALAVFICALLSAFLLPLAYYLSFRHKYEITLYTNKLLLMFLSAILTWFAACAAIWVVSLIFGKKVGYIGIMSSWGFSYIPNMVCLIAYGILKMNMFQAAYNPYIAALINTFFIMLLVWKAIFFFIEMRYVLKLEALEILAAMVVIGLIFAVLMAAGFYAGLHVPML